MGEEALPSEYNMHIYIYMSYIHIYIIDKLLQTRWDVQPSEKQLASFTMQLHATTQQLYMYGIIPAVYCRFWRRLIHFVIFSTSSLFTPCCTLVSKEIFPTRPSQSLPVDWCGLPNLLTLLSSLFWGGLASKSLVWVLGIAGLDTPSPGPVINKSPSLWSSHLRRVSPVVITTMGKLAATISQRNINCLHLRVQ